METTQQSVPLLLQRVPNGRRAPVRLFTAVFLPYASLMLGPAVAAACALYNALALRRVRPAVVAVFLGLAGWVGFGFFLEVVVSAGLKTPSLALLPGRLMNIGVGVLLAWSQWAYVRGHRFLDGRVVGLLPSVMVAFAIFVFLPRVPGLLLQGAWQVLFLR